MKRKLLLLMCLCLLAGINAYAQEYAEIDGIYYELSEDEATVIYNYNGEGYSGAVVIPSSVTYEEKTYNVTCIGGNAFGECADLTSITIPNSVTGIGDNAFYGCSSLISFTIPENVISIGEYAFYGCYFTKDAFVNNSALTSEDNWGAKIYDVETEDGLLIGDNVIIGIRSLETASVTIPENVTDIDRRFLNEWCNRGSLTSVTIHCKEIGDDWFFGMSSLEEVVIGDEVTRIGNTCFCYCSSLTSVTIGNNVASIGFDTFYATPWYDELPEGLVYLGKVAYRYIGEMPEGTEIVIQDGTLGIAGAAFAGCSGLASITIPESVTSIGEWAFADCFFTEGNFVNNSTLTDDENWGAIIYDEETADGLIISDGIVVKYKGTATSVSIPEGVTGIGESAFYDCITLNSVTIPNSVTTIGEWAFAYSGLTSVTIGNGVTSIGEYAFADCFFKTEDFVNNSALTSDDNWGAVIYDMETEDGLLIKDNIVLMCRHYWADVITIPDNVTGIARNAFEMCGDLQKIRCLAETVPEAEDIILGFHVYYDDIILEVPADAVEDYGSHPCWGQFLIYSWGDLVLDENTTKTVAGGTFDSVTLKRTFVAGWNTVCLPFDIENVEEFFGEGAKAYYLDEYSYTDGALSFKTLTSLGAGCPYIVYVPTAITEDFILTDFTITHSRRLGYEDDFWDWSSRVGFCGTYAPIASGELIKQAEAIYGLTADGHIMKAGEYASIKGFRAYFSAPSNLEVKALRFDDNETIIASPLEETIERDAIYNMAGQRIQEIQKGINIVNGKKILK